MPVFDPTTKRRRYLRLKTGDECPACHRAPLERDPETRELICPTAPDCGAIFPWDALVEPADLEPCA